MLVLFSFWINPQSRENRKNSRQTALCESKKFLTSKGNHYQNEENLQDRIKYCKPSWHMVYIQKLSSKSKHPSDNGQNSYLSISPKETYKQPTDTRETPQHHQAPEKRKLKPHEISPISQEKNDYHQKGKGP